MEGFKVLLEIENEDKTISLVSYFHDISEHLIIKYQIGMNVPQVEGTKIYFFDTLKNAINYSEGSILKTHIIKCQAVNAVKSYAMLDIGFVGQDLYKPYKYMDELERLNKKPKIIGHSVPAEGTYETDELELIERVN